MFSICLNGKNIMQCAHSVCIYAECIIFSLRVAIDLWCFVQCDETVFFVYMFPPKFENMQQQQQEQQQPLPIYFGVEFDLNDNFFLLEREKKTRACRNIRSCICNAHTSCYFEHRLCWIHHFD